MEKEILTRARGLLGKMTVGEKLARLCSDMIFDIDETYESRRCPLLGSYRNPGHFMHNSLGRTASPSEVARRINRDVLLSLRAREGSADGDPADGVPPIENGEALHGAQWGMATCFPQPIAMASSFDPALQEEVADVIGKECRAVGVRQVFAPVVNVVRDCRWGRTVETFGEDVMLVSDFGAAMCAGLEKNGVIATPKHFADNYSDGGRDSNFSTTDERTLREVFLPPFKACFDAGAQSVMAAYNSVNGRPCTCDGRLLNDILRGEWGFEGFVVTDYGGVDGLVNKHMLFADYQTAAAESIKNGLDVILPFDRLDELTKAFEKGYFSEEELDRSVLRVLCAEIKSGIVDEPFADEDAADAAVRSPEHRELALRAARECIVLLKNDGALPLRRGATKRIAVFGSGAQVVPVGSNYSGPYGVGWSAPDALTPLEALERFSGAEVVFGADDEIERLAPECDAAIYFTSVIEGEGSDRSDIRLPGVMTSSNRSDDGGIIVDEKTQSSRVDQEKSILAMCRANKNSAVVLLNGSPVDMSAWIDAAPAVVEAWYPGEQGAQATVEVLFGDVNPSGKLPITFPKSVGQLPLYYSYKPGGRGYGYCDNDGKPLFEFGHGLSYTSFALDKARLSKDGDGVKIAGKLKNTGGSDGAEVLQAYLCARNCDVVMPLKRLVGYARVSVPAGGCADFEISVGPEAFCYYDRDMRFGAHGGDFGIILGTSSETELARFTVSPDTAPEKTER
ncbi:MAG: glycoside hydrolase family 3 C-terminal domain-containing protein [Clostridia bacterium]|nr:glycoside hydrolase family 3 C-terminal domain-containing protein [Clostridia bacterium]